jgi:hypothetical protein
MKIGKWLALGVGVLSVVLVLWVARAVVIGYTAYKPADPGWVGVAGKTLWDWLKLLVVPFVIAVVGTVGGYYFARSENRAAQAIADKRTQDEALQAYLDQIGQLLLDKDQPLRDSEEDSEVRVLARAQTLALLPRLDPQHKRRVLHFLFEARLILTGGPEKWSGTVGLFSSAPPVIPLRDANLDHVDLRDMSFGWVDFSGAMLRHADMTKSFRQ